MLQCEHLFCVFVSSQIPDDWGKPVFFFFAQMMSCVVLYQFSILKYLKTWGLTALHAAVGKFKLSHL